MTPDSEWTAIFRGSCDRASWAEIQKFVRKKVFKLNGFGEKDASRQLCEGDELEIYLSDESFSALSSIGDIDYKRDGGAVINAGAGINAGVGMGPWARPPEKRGF